MFHLDFALQVVVRYEYMLISNPTSALMPASLFRGSRLEILRSIVVKRTGNLKYSPLISCCLCSSILPSHSGRCYLLDIAPLSLGNRNHFDRLDSEPKQRSCGLCRNGSRLGDWPTGPAGRPEVRIAKNDLTLKIRWPRHQWRVWVRARELNAPIDGRPVVDHGNRGQ
jgi:hypothetical protein